MQILLLTLDTFSRMGGIQQFNRNLQLALSAYVAHNGGHLTHISVLDHTADADARYVAPDAGERFTFRGFGGKKFAFIRHVAGQAGRFDRVIFGHVNLAPLAMLPGFRLRQKWMVAHGVEVWQPLPLLKKRGLQQMDRLLCVSQYTRHRVQDLYGLPAEKLAYFPNCLDPFFAEMPLPPVQQWNRHWRLDTTRPYLITVARLAATEAAKGYDEVIRMLPELAAQVPNISYILAGKSDEAEYRRIRQLAESLGVGDRVLMPGFVPAESLPALYHLAKCFVLPSTKEGFGIVYLEAAWWGCPVVAYRAGGVPEALLEGQLGTLVPPGEKVMLQNALLRTLNDSFERESRVAGNRSALTGHFSFSLFEKRLADLLKQA